MGVFTLRTAAGTSALRGSDYLRQRTYVTGWHLYVDGIDRIADADRTTLSIADAGPNATGRLQVTYADAVGTASIAPTALVEFVDGSGSAVVYAGRLISRQLEPGYGGRGVDYALDAVDLSAWLDWIVIPDDTIADGTSDRDAVQYLITTYATSAGLTAPDATVELTTLALYDVYFVGKTLRQALETVAAAAGDNRAFFVDADGRLNYGLLSSSPAPYAISDAPNGTTSIAAEELTYESDTSQIVNAVYIATAPEDAIYADWVTDATSIATYGRREAFYVNELVEDAATAAQYGSSYLATRKDPTIRGSFTISQGFDGWKAGQTVTITNTRLGLSAATFLISAVDTEFLSGTGRRRYRIAFGSLPKSLVRLLAAT